jgi:RNA polymerase sigma-70 factor (ECF subfamily)
MKSYTSNRIPPAALERLLSARAEFLSFLSRRTGSMDAAEEILQAAYLKGLEKGGALRDEESAVAWFYRLLRNAVVDHWRAKGASRELAMDRLPEVAVEPEIRKEVCGCIRAALAAMKPEYREALESVDIRETPVGAYAKAAGIGAGNASVRLNRARHTLRKRILLACGPCCKVDGCAYCTCGETGAKASETSRAEP